MNRVMHGYVLCSLLTVALRAVAEEAASPTPQLPPLDKAAWIWDAPKAKTDGTFGVFFRKTFDLAERPTTATVLATADNGYDLFVNGSLVGGDAGFDGIYWSSVEKYDIQHLLEPGKNVIAVRGENMGGPAGLIVAARIELPAGEAVELWSDQSWRFSLDPHTEWTTAGLDDSKWAKAVVLGANGMAPWGKLKYPGPVSPRHTGRGGPSGLTEPGDDFAFPAGIVFVRGRVPESSTPGAPQSIWRIGGSRAYLEFDTPAPAALGQRLYSLVPVRPGGEPTLLADAGGGVLGSPSVSYDGKTIYFAMAPAGEHFFHLYSLPAPQAPGALQSTITNPQSPIQPLQLTHGPFHDYDPEPLPDGRLVFSSTRIGSREEYHGNVGRSLFTMNADGTSIRPLTQHIVGDNEPRVTADGDIAFIRCDNFMERAKVETQIHLIRPDGSGGQVIFGANRDAIGYSREHAAEGDSRWLRRYGFGSPAPLPDGRIACLSASGPVIASGDSFSPEPLNPAVNVFDLAPLPDGRLLCTTASRGTIGVLDPDTGEVVRVYSTTTYDLHSPTFLGSRPKPRGLSSHLTPDKPGRESTGFLLCTNALYTKQTEVDTRRVKAIRVVEGVPFTNRSARHPYAHLGVEAVELGTVPLAPDGSFFIEVPADRALALQAVDAEGRSVINEMTWIYVRPGERRSCTGCHASQRATPTDPPVAALRNPAVRLLGRGDPHRFRGNNAANGGVLNLQFDRFREAAAINLYPVSRAGDKASQPSARAGTVKRLCELLATGTDEQKASAAQRLAVIRDRSSTPALVAALSEKSANVRRAAAFALSACGNRDAVAQLVEALEDADPVVALSVAIALENLTGQAPPGDRPDWDAIENAAITRIRSDDPVTVQQAIETLGHIGADRARTALRAYVTANTDDDTRLLLAAIRALGHLRDKDAVPLLTELLVDNIGVKPGQAPANPEFGWLQKPVHLAAAAAEALGWIGTPEAEAALIDAYPKLQSFWYYTHRTGDHAWLMGCHSSVLHYRIAEALDAMGSKKAAVIVPHLLKSIPIDTDRALLFENDSYETLVGLAVNRTGRADQVVETCLAVLGDANAKPVAELREAVTASPPAQSTGPLGKESRAALIASVVCIDARYAPRLCAAFDRFRAQQPSRERSWTCFYLARTLGKLRAPGSTPSLLAALNEDATEGSFGYETPPNVFLYKAMTPFYRAAAAYALGEIGDTDAAPSLLHVVEDFDNAMDVRHAAARTLTKLADGADGGETWVARLRRVAGDYPEVATRNVLARAARAALRSPST